MESTEKTMWEYHLKEAKKRVVPVRPSLEIGTGIVIDKLLDDTAKKVQIPAEIDGYPVNIIGKRAFIDCRQLEEVEIPDSVLVIEDEAFAGCESLTKITMPPKLRKMMHGVFRYCTALEEIEFPDKLILISFETFQGCTSLKKVKLPENLIRTGTQTFEGCVSLETIDLPETVRNIEIGAFEGCKRLKEIKIPSSVTRIGAWAFDGCSSLKEIDLPEGITRINKCTFRNCTSLERIRIPASVTYIGDEKINWFAAYINENGGEAEMCNPMEGCDNLKEIWVCAGSYGDNWARENGYRKLLCTEELSVDYRVCEETQTVEITDLRDRTLERLVIPGIIENCPVVKIAEEAFTFCENLVHVTVPDTVQVIGEGAFRMCSNLQSLQLPLSVNRIHSTAVMGCENLKKIITKPDSFAEEWATECGFEVHYVE